MNGSELIDKELESRINNIIASAPFLHLIGIRPEKVERGSVKIYIENCEPLTQQAGIVHGGAISSLLDTSAALSVMSLLEKEETATTIDLTVHFLRPIARGKITAIANIIRAGRKVITVSAEVFDEEERLCATALTTYLRLA
jgi:uncharacterized protein (TIGR00369 family)